MLSLALRICSESAFSHQICQMRTLSATDAVNALRPFYFAVHPDFFGQHPREREVNENSLKRLNGYLECLQRSDYKPLKPTHLTFYMRETDSCTNLSQQCLNLTGFRTVSFTLQSKDLLSAIVNILKSCSLSTEHMQDLQTDEGKQQPQQQQQTSAAPFSRPIRWDKAFYAFTGRKNPEEELEAARQIEPTLGLWLDKNIPTATKKLNDSVPLRDELDRLKSELCQQLELLDLRWHRSWGVSHRCSQLHSLSRFAQQDSHARQNLKGCTLIFTDHTGMNAAGEVMLGTVDVHYQWTKLLERLPSYHNLHSQFSLLEERISYLLGDVQLIYDEDLQSILMLEDYYKMLKCFHQRVSVHRPLFHPRSLKGLQMILDNDCSAPRLLESGHFSIPTMCDPIVLQWFIVAHAEKARSNLKRNEVLKAEEEKLIQDCMVNFGLYKLYKESSVSSEQMVKCCQRLFEERATELQGMHLCVSHFYSVLQDGELCIPWDWKK